MLIALIAVVLVSSIVYVCRPRETQHLSRLQSVEDALERDRSCIDFTYAGPNTSLQQRLELRAAPNLRLRRAFGITNSFTTTDIRKHQKFLRKATRAIGGTNWQRILKSAVEVIRSRTLDEALEQHTACLSRTLLAPFCRGICLRMILDVLFEIRPLSPEEVDIQTIATGINSQWIASKTNVRTSQSKELNDTLSRVLQLSSVPDMSPQEALGLIMPSYETLWRVVLLTFVTAFHRTVNPMNASILEVKMNLAASRNLPPRFRRIAKEGLRLYPSTKRVYRAHPTDPASTPVSADVEKWHRHPAIWGDNAGEFRPERFERLTRLQEAAYMPFGLKPHLCPAYKIFGEMMVTILVAALGAELPKTRVVLTFHDELLDSDIRTALPTGRDDMEDWTMDFLSRLRS